MATKKSAVVTKKAPPLSAKPLTVIARRKKETTNEAPEPAPTKRLRGEAALTELRSDIAIAAKGVLDKYSKKLALTNRKCTEAQMREILHRVSIGESLSKILREDPAMPSAVTFHDMLNKIPELEIEYTKALARRAERFADELVELSDLALGGSPEDVQALKLMVNTRQWIASRLLPKKYGDKVTVAGDAENPLVTHLVMSSAELLKKIKG